MMKKLCLALSLLLALALLAGCGETEKKDDAVKVSTVDELLAAIAPDTVIELAPGTYDLSTASDYNTESDSAFYSWDEVFDGVQLKIKSVTNLTIRAASDNPTETVITAVPRYANVMYFVKCENITVSGITAGHTVEPGACSGGVLSYDACKNISVESCRLYGCGTIGIEAMRCDVLSAKGCEIYDCSYDGVSIYETTNASFENCSIHDIDGPCVSAFEGSAFTWNGTAMEEGVYNMNSDGSLQPLAG